MLRWLNITPLLIEHKNEICADLIQMHRQGVITESAFCCTLVPEGTPVLDKATELARRFAAFQEELGDSKMPAGILLQATIGHGWAPDSPASFQKLVRRDGSEPYMFCPLGRDFRNYITAAVRQLARLRPAFFMVDDDFRMYTGRPGCFCPLHLAEFNRRMGTAHTRESVAALVDSNEDAARAYDRMLCDSLMEVAALIRSAVDETDPSIPGSLSTCAGDLRHAPEIARKLAASGQRPLIRINNGFYMNDSLRRYPQWLYRTAVQVAAMPKDVEVIAEPDTCPHNRYSTSAAIMHAHNAFSLLEGCKGGKIWLSRLQSHEPASGKAYRDILAKHVGFYQAVDELTPSWQGVAIAVPDGEFFNFPRQVDGTGSNDNWAAFVVGRMGIPVHFSARPKGTTAISGQEVRIFSDDQLRELLRGKLLLDGPAALAICKRGFAKELGVNVREWKNKPVTFEKTPDGGIIPTFGSGGIVELELLSPQTQSLSRLYHSPFAFSQEEYDLAPGATFFKNAEGGTIAIIAGAANTHGFEAFFMLNETRKRQLIAILNLLEPLPVYYPDDAEVMLKAGKVEGGTLVALLNIGLDPIEGLPLNGPATRNRKAEMLTPEGKWISLKCKATADGLMIDLSLPPCGVLVCRLSD